MSITQTTIITTINLGGRDRIVSSDYAKDFKPEAVSKWEFTFRVPTVRDEIEVGRLVAETGVLGPPCADINAVMLARGEAYLKTVVVGMTTPNEVGLSDCVDDLSPFVLKELAQRIQFGETVGQAEIDALKNDASASGS